LDPALDSRIPLNPVAHVLAIFCTSYGKNLPGPDKKLFPKQPNPLGKNLPRPDKKLFTTQPNPPGKNFYQTPSLIYNFLPALGKNLPKP
jgi:hypothetical protein